MAPNAYFQLIYMTMATWTTQVVAAQKMSEALSQFYDRSASPSEHSMGDLAPAYSG
jgi:hypothetical protein